MADKSFGVKELNLLNASGTPTVTSPNNLNLNANTVAISTSCTIGNNLTITSTTTSANVNVTGIATVVNFNATGVSTIAQPSNTNAHSAWLVTAKGDNSAYHFTGPGQDGANEDDPDLYLVRGQRYIFTNNSGGSHPFQIRVANGGAAYSDGVTNNGASSGNIIFNVQHDAPAQLFYQCTSHGGMVGNIYIVGGPQVVSGVVTATTFVGNLTGNVTGTASGNAVLTGSTNDQLVTVTGANAITGESNFTYDGDIATITRSANAAGGLSIINTNNSQASAHARLELSAGDNSSAIMRMECNGHANELIADGSGNFRIDDNGTERLRIDANGKVSIASGAYGGGGTTPELYVKGTSGRQMKIHNSNAGTSSLQITNASTGEGEDAGTQLFTQGTTGDFHIQNAFATGEIAFGTRPSGGSTTERLRIADDGDIGVGVASPDGRFHIMGGNLGGAGTVTADTAGNLLVLESNTSQGMSILVASDERANIYFGTPGTGGQIEAGIQYAHESVSTTADRRAMIFRVGGGERARIQTGRLLVGRTTPITITGDGSSHVFEQLDDNGYAVGLHCDQSNQRGLGIYYNTSRSPSDAIRFVVGSSAKFIVLGTGNVTNANNSYGNISDVSLKENIIDAGSQWNDIKNIKIRNYNFKESTGQETHKQIGVVAQELETVCPKLVSTDQDGMKNVASSVLYMKAVKALQEAMARIETLEAEVAALKSS